ncbi:hypothetical protein N6L27_03625 [Leisingera sp. SS27]|uniref:hypothetical protein n=1 Tax=Leisingera sp. SS27 TaxID=2979462 RepID=UPI00232D91BF|nr:hypothetical protein [Leisingera sp. SS27]MDC0657080.1 hypothetical protein [Leisingera sp. SS27]
MTNITILPAATSRAATTPAANTTHGFEQCRRGQDDPENRGPSAQVFEDFNGQHFHDEWTQALVLGVWALAFLVAAGTAIAAPYVLRLLFALFDLMGLAL